MILNAFSPQLPGPVSDMPPAEEPEVAGNVNATDVGNLGLTPMEGMAIFRLMQTLSDGHSAP